MFARELVIDFELSKTAQFEHHCLSTHNVWICSLVYLDNACLTLGLFDFDLQLCNLLLHVWQPLTNLTVLVAHLLHLIP